MQTKWRVDTTTEYSRYRRLLLSGLVMGFVSRCSLDINISSRTSLEFVDKVVGDALHIWLFNSELIPEITEDGSMCPGISPGRFGGYGKL